jgi:MFS family permease
MALSLGKLTSRLGPRRVLLMMMGSLPFALALYAGAPVLAASALALLVVGALYLGALSTFMTIAQLRAPAEIRGRVLSVLTVILGSMYPLGAVVQGKLADTYGLRVVTFASGAALLAVQLVVRAVRPGFTKPLDEPVTLTTA